MPVFAYGTYQIVSICLSLFLLVFYRNVDIAWTQKRFLPYGICYAIKQPYGKLLFRKILRIIWDYFPIIK